MLTSTLTHPGFYCAVFFALLIWFVAGAAKHAAAAAGPESAAITPARAGAVAGVFVAAFPFLLALNGWDTFLATDTDTAETVRWFTLVLVGLTVVGSVLNFLVRDTWHSVQVLYLTVAGLAAVLFLYAL